jgi:hypothetical protein
MPREPNERDINYLQTSLELLTAYDYGIRKDDFGDYIERLGKCGTLYHLEAMTQLAWLILHSAEANGLGNRSEILQFYGLRFAKRLEEHKES